MLIFLKRCWLTTLSTLLLISSGKQKNAPNVDRRLEIQQNASTIEYPSSSCYPNFRIDPYILSRKCSQSCGLQHTSGSDFSHFSALEKASRTTCCNRNGFCKLKYSHSINKHKVSFLNKAENNISRWTIGKIQFLNNSALLFQVSLCKCYFETSSHLRGRVNPPPSPPWLLDML